LGYTRPSVGCHAQNEKKVNFSSKGVKNRFFVLAYFRFSFVEIKKFLTYLIEKWVKLAIFEKKMQFKGLKKAIPPQKS